MEYDVQVRSDRPDDENWVFWKTQQVTYNRDMAEQSYQHFVENWGYSHSVRLRVVESEDVFEVLQHHKSHFNGV